MGWNMILIVAKSIIKKEYIKEYKDLVKELIEKSRKEEGNISYDLHQDINNPQAFVFVEYWKDIESIEAHNNSEHFKKIIPEINKIRESVEATRYEKLDY